MEFTVTDEIKQSLNEAVAKTIQESDFYAFKRGVQEALDKKLIEDGFYERVAGKLYEHLMTDEQALIENLSASETFKTHLSNMVESILNKTLEEFNKKVQSYGFIKIDGRF